jgi:hypothetical protein
LAYSVIVVLDRVTFNWFNWDPVRIAVELVQLMIGMIVGAIFGT